MQSFNFFRKIERTFLQLGGKVSRLSSFLLLLCICFSGHVQAEDEVFYPCIYDNDVWSDFCVAHLKQYPLQCGEYDTYVEGDFPTFLKTGSSRFHVSEETLVKLSDYLDKIPNIGRCGFRFCSECRVPLLRGVFDQSDFDNAILEDDPEDNGFRYEKIGNVIGEKCLYSKSWQDSHLVDMRTRLWPGFWPHKLCKDWCGKKAPPYNYFDVANQQFIPFLEQHLKYSQENPECLCYWPHRSQEAFKISDLMYRKVKYLVNESSLSGLIEQENPPVEFPYLKNRSSKGVVTGLFTHAFFYSQYREILLQLGQWMETLPLSYSWETIEDRQEEAEQLYDVIETIQPHFLTLYSDCLEKHPHPKIYYERGMIFLHQGRAVESLGDIRKMIEWAEKENIPDLLSSDLYLQEGTLNSELGLYDQAVTSLTKAIQKNPQNKEAYFERSVAYLELGDFDASLDDYLISGIRPKPIAKTSRDKLDFAFGLMRGISQGSLQGGVEFFPSMFSSLGGIGQGLWVFVKDPVNASFDLVDSVQSCVQFVRKNSGLEIISALVPELRDLIGNWDNLSQEARGDLTGQIIGKYGVDIFAGAALTKGVTKGVAAFKNLRRANNLLTVEAMSISAENRALIKLEVAKRTLGRKEFFKNAHLKIQWDKQGKHIAGHRNFELPRNRSILEHPDPQKLVKEFGGKGMKIGNNQPGTAGYQELVNFGEFIGYDIERETGVRTATTWGKIHYAQDGVHIVPSKPRL